MNKKLTINLVLLGLFAYTSISYGIIGGLLETAGNTVIGAGEVAVDTVKGVGRSFAEPKILPGKPERLQRLEDDHNTVKTYYEEKQPQEELQEIDTIEYSAS